MSCLGNNPNSTSMCGSVMPVYMLIYLEISTCGEAEFGVNWPSAFLILIVLSRRSLVSSFENRSSRQVSFKIGRLDMGAALKVVVCDGRATSLVANQPCSQLGIPSVVQVTETKGCA